ncbi:MAG: ABC transporter ATP-binding protein, partial [Actinobacteria bacterium]|nr:ABC transporter ATP-binding protein [Actinomycetota bacterium]
GVRAGLARVIAGVGIPVVLVTHDMADAAALECDVAVLDRGQVVQHGDRTALMARPSTPTVATLMGANLLPGTARPGPAGLTEVVLDTGGTLASGETGSGRVGVVVDPWDVTLVHGRPGDSQLNHLPGTVASLTPVGNRVRVQVGPVTADVTALSAERMGLAVGAPVTAVFKALSTRLVVLGDEPDRLP